MAHRKDASNRLFLVGIQALFIAAALAPWPIEEAMAQPGADTEGEGTSPEPLRIEVEPTLEDADRFPRWIEERSRAAVEGIGERSGHEQWIAVSLGGETYAYRVEVVAMRDGMPLGEPRGAVGCKCTSEELLLFVDEEVARAAKELTRAAPEGEDDPEPASGGEPEGAETPGDGGETADGASKRPPLKWWGKAGLGLAVAGGAGVIGGIGMMIADERPIRSGFQIARSRDWSKAGITTLGVGAGLLVGGVTLLVLDLTTCRRDPSRCEDSTATVSVRRRSAAIERHRRRPRAAAVLVPWLADGGAGMGLAGQF